ncbi:MAG: hypothetical protein HOP29_08790 [Phycisphaerales bacterium]|nr:hypothetical protein [Phycisphaerales bacterium]
MPVLGHAFAGVATAAAARSARPTTLAPSAWTALMVGFAYLPDVIGHGLLLCGVMTGPLWAHSVPVALPAAVIVGAVVSTLLYVPMAPVTALAALSVLIHIALDLLNGTTRAPWWPVAEQWVELRWTPLPDDPLNEFIYFCGAALVFLTGWWMRRPSAAISSPQTPTSAAARFRLVGHAAVIAIVAAAAIVHVLRGVRQSQLVRARATASTGDHAEAIRLAESAARWPWATGPGSAQYVMAEMLHQSGDRARAEAMYLESCRLGPDKFWPAADLALFHASGPEPTAERRRRVDPWRNVLSRRFARHPDLPRMLDKIDRALTSGDVTADHRRHSAEPDVSRGPTR